MAETRVVSPGGGEGEVGAAGDEGWEGIEDSFLLPGSDLMSVEAPSGE